MRYKPLIFLMICMVLAAVSLAQEAPPVDDSAAAVSMWRPAPVTNLQAVDKPDDHGHGIILTWEPSADENVPEGEVTRVMGYQVYRWRPDFAFRLDTLRQKFNLVQAKRHTFAVYRDKVERALTQVEAGTTDPEELSFIPALPSTDSAYAPTAEELTQALNDTLAAMDAEVEYSKDSVKAYRRMFLDSVAYLPVAYATYPQNGRWVEVGGPQPPGTAEFDHIGAKEKEGGDYSPDNTGFYYRVHTLTPDPRIESVSEVFGPVESSGQWYNKGKTANLIFVLLFGAALLTFVRLARKGSDLYVRPLAGIEAVDEAIGRATEMGKPILYVLGLGTAADVATIASFTILGRVAKRVAEYQTQLIVPTYDPIVMSVAQEVVKSAYMDAGRPDEYNEDTVFFVTQLQFAYVAAVNGIMLRELPATNVYMGKFFAESLLMAETGAVAGSIQIAGTDEIAQIPFFIVACDYTLIGEELYAASAYLGREPILLGSLKAQDWAKAAILILALAGMFFAHFEWGATFTELFHVTN